MGLFSSGKGKSTSTAKKESKKAAKKRKWKDTNEKYKFVCESGRVKCRFCSTPLSTIKVTSNNISLQDVPYMTTADNNGVINLNFLGVCLHPKAPKASGKPLPCKALISLTKWEKASETYINANRALIVDSTIKCSVSNSNLTIAHSGQKDVLKDVKPTLKLIEKGIVRKGYWKTEGAKIIILDDKGERGYDWMYADNPSEAVMKENRMTDYDVFNINLTKSYSETHLKTEMKSVLWLSSDVEDGFGANGRNVANHFFKGQGVPFTFKDGSNPSREIRDSERFNKTFLNSLGLELLNKLKETKYISKGQDIYQFSTGLPYYKATEAVNPFINEAATFIGGIQGAEVEYEVYEQSHPKIQSVKLTKVTFYDTFGAGWEDGGAEGAVKQWIPGLVAMFCLQHFKNVEDNTKYQPFAIKVEINL